MKQLFRSVLERIEISKFERRAVIALLFFVTGISIYKVFYWNVLYFEAPEFDYRAKYNQVKEAGLNNEEWNLRPFDPNIVQVDDLIEMGLRSDLAHNIVNFRLKVHPYRSIQDVKKLYLMDSTVFRKIEPYIQLEQTKDNYKYSTRKTEDFQNYKPNKSQRMVKEVYNVDLNSCDEEDLKQLPGIGPVYAKRIIGFRELLGGFVDVKQLKEVYGIEDSLVDQLKQYVFLTNDSLVQIHLNSVDIKTLIRHPYIDYKNAKLLLRYRAAHGPFDKLTFDQIHGLDQDMINKIKPYLTLD